MSLGKRLKGNTSEKSETVTASSPAEKLSRESVVGWVCKNGCKEKKTARPIAGAVPFSCCSGGSRVSKSSSCSKMLLPCNTIHCCIGT